MLKCKPLREITANSMSTTVFFFSKKLQRQVMCESNLEWDTAIVIEHDPTVIDYCEQAIELNWSESNWIPDFVILLKNREGSYDILIIEVKYLKELLEDKDHFKLKYIETKEWINNNYNLLVNKITNLPVRKIDFLVVTEQIINQSFRVQNLRELMEATVDPAIKIEIFRQVKVILLNNPKIEIDRLIHSITLRHLPESIREDDIWTAIYEMIYNFEIFTDYEQLITSKSRVSLPYGNFNYESIDNWLKKFNWENQNIIDSTIPYSDLYGLHENPEKSIQLWEEANNRYEIIKDLIKIPFKELKKKKLEYNGRTYHWRTIQN